MVSVAPALAREPSPGVSTKTTPSRRRGDGSSTLMRATCFALNDAHRQKLSLKFDGHFQTQLEGFAGLIRAVESNQNCLNHHSLSSSGCFSHADGFGLRVRLCNHLRKQMTG